MDAREILKRIRRRLRHTARRPDDLEEQIYCAVIRHGDVICDIGANEGAVAVFLSSLAGSPGLVLAFEPVWPVYQKLCARIQRRVRRGAPIIPVPLGLSEFAGTFPVHVPDDKFGLASLAAPERRGSPDDGGRVQHYECSFVALDAFWKAAQLPPPDFLKIDVEGAEFLVLKGAQQILSSSNRPLMLVELFAPWEKKFGYSPWGILSMLVRYDYQFMFQCPEGLKVHAPSAGDSFPPGYDRGYNVIAYVPGLHTARIQGLIPLLAGGTGRVLSMAPPPQPNLIS